MNLESRKGDVLFPKGAPTTTLQVKTIQWRYWGRKSCSLLFLILFFDHVPWSLFKISFRRDFRSIRSWKFYVWGLKIEETQGRDKYWHVFENNLCIEIYTHFIHSVKASRAWKSMVEKNKERLIHLVFYWLYMRFWPQIWHITSIFQWASVEVIRRFDIFGWHSNKISSLLLHCQILCAILTYRQIYA